MKSKRRSTKKPLYKQRPVLITAAIVLVALSLLFILVFHNNKPPSDNEPSTANSQIQKAEQNDVNQNKANLGGTNKDQSDNTGSSQSNGKSVVITYAGYTNQTLQVSSYVQGVFEDGGTCRLQLSQGEQVIKKDAVGLEDVNHTTCPTFMLDSASYPQIKSGVWNATVTYFSSSQTVPLVSTTESVEVK